MAIDRMLLDEVEVGRRPGVVRLLAAVPGSPPAAVPVITIAGERPGPVFAATAGVHGDEYEGPRALWELCAALAPSSLAGVVVALPLCNPWAFTAASRATPEQIDGVNLARTFPGDPNGSPTQRLAAGLLAFVLRLRPALFLDLHSGGARYRYLPMIGYRHGLGDAKRARAAARAFGVPNLWRLRDHPGTFNSETARRGITTVGVEMSGAGGCLDADVAADREGTLNLLRWLGMLRDRPAPETPGPFWQMTDVPAAAGGYVELHETVGTAVARGAALATVRSLFGDPVDDARAPHDGTIWVTRHLRVIDHGETLASVARPEDAGG